MGLGGGILRIGTLSFFAYLWTNHKQDRRGWGGIITTWPVGRVLLVLVLFILICNGSHMGWGGGLLRLALSASLLTSSLCRKGVDGGGFFMLELSASLLTSPHGGVRRGRGDFHI